MVSRWRAEPACIHQILMRARLLKGPVQEQEHPIRERAAPRGRDMMKVQRLPDRVPVRRRAAAMCREDQRQTATGHRDLARYRAVRTRQVPARRREPVPHREPVLRREAVTHPERLRHREAAARPEPVQHLEVVIHPERLQHREAIPRQEPGRREVRQEPEPVRCREAVRHPEPVRHREAARDQGPVHRGQAAAPPEPDRTVRYQDLDNSLLTDPWKSDRCTQPAEGLYRKARIRQRVHNIIIIPSQNRHNSLLYFSYNKMKYKERGL